MAKTFDDGINLEGELALTVGGIEQITDKISYLVKHYLHSIFAQLGLQLIYSLGIEWVRIRILFELFSTHTDQTKSITEPHLTKLGYDRILQQFFFVLVFDTNLTLNTSRKEWTK